MTATAAPCGSDRMASQPYGLSVGPCITWPSTAARGGNGRVGVVNHEVDQPVRRHPRRHLGGHRHQPADRVVGHGEQRVRLTARLDLLGAMPEDGGGEAQRRVDVAGQQLVPGQRAGLVRKLRSDVVARLPAPERRAGRVARHERVPGP